MITHGFIDFFHFLGLYYFGLNSLIRTPRTSHNYISLINRSVSICDSAKIATVRITYHVVWYLSV